MARTAHTTLVASTVATLSIDADSARATAEIVNVDGAAAIYYRTDGTDPAVAAADSFVVPATIGARAVVRANSVKVISSGTPKVAFQRI